MWLIISRLVPIVLMVVSRSNSKQRNNKLKAPMHLNRGNQEQQQINNEINKNSHMDKLKATEFQSNSRLTRNTNLNPQFKKNEGKTGPENRD